MGSPVFGLLLTGHKVLHTGLPARNNTGLAGNEPLLLSGSYLILPRFLLH